MGTTIGIGNFVGNSLGSAPAQEVLEIKYGFLYNWYAASDAKNLANTGWRLPILTDTETFQTYIGSNAPKIRIVGSGTWSLAEATCTNEYKMNLYGGVYLTSYWFFKGYWVYEFGTGGIGRWHYYDASSSKYWQLQSNDNIVHLAIDPKTYGYPIRLIKETTILTHGQEGTYTGNNGRVYKTICINDQEWTAENLVETKYRTGDPIPEVQVQATWQELTTGAYCTMNNNYDDVYL